MNTETAATNLEVLPMFGTKPDADTYRRRVPHLFGSDESLRWFLREHRDELVSEGALLWVSGKWLCRPAVMTTAVIKIGEREARAVLEAKSAA